VAGVRGTVHWWAAAWPAASSAAAHRRGPLPPRGQPRTRPQPVLAVTHPGWPRQQELTGWSSRAAGIPSRARSDSYQDDGGGIRPNASGTAIR
jgi:hypothetical protein